jgi:phosphate starvation-inducible PhoH-like protein
MPRAKKYPTPAKSENSIFIKPLSIKNAAQEHYLNTIRESTLTFCTGPAGTGKTFIASYVALQALLDREVDKVILTRPIVATEDIGYLPGDMNEKIHPYLMPLLDAIEAHVGPTKCKELLEMGKLEILPLAFMRGRSLNRCIMLLDEAQNTTTTQMKMFLTRIGYDSKIIINGDMSQTDLPKHVESGLSFAVDRLTGKTEDISVVAFSSREIVRNPLIEKILMHLDGPPPREAFYGNLSRAAGELAAA